ncbi:MAG: hypothetical protein LBN23_03920 [Paludibacter sp.]|jgi:hypothetical protein|nr:hypothetical protein [Paludibacter sp.]
MKIPVYKIIVLLSLILVSCVPYPSETVYRYNKNPQYTHGEAVFYGAYYADYGNLNHVVSLSLLSDSLEIKNGSFAGVGQYLCITDIFISPADVLLPDGTYTAADSGEPFTFYGGEILRIDSVDYTLRAYISFVEKNEQLSKTQLITRGSFTVTNDGYDENGARQTIVCDFVLSDSTKLYGIFSDTLPYRDQSIGVFNTKRQFRPLVIPSGK